MTKIKAGSKSRADLVVAVGAPSLSDIESGDGSSGDSSDGEDAGGGGSGRGGGSGNPAPRVASTSAQAFQGDSEDGDSS